MEIINWNWIKCITFQEFKLIGGVNRFEEFIKQLGLKTKLVQLELINFSSFVTFNYQAVFTKHLNRFKYLKKLDLSYLNFFLTQNFLNSLFELSPSLTSLKLKIDNFDVNLLKPNLDKFYSVILVYFT